MELFAHQQKLLTQNPIRHLLAWGTGTGKTRTGIELANLNKVDVLIVCPKGLKRNWVRELAKWGDTDLCYEVVSKEEFRRDWNTIRPHNAVMIDEGHTFAGMKSQLHKTMVKYLKKHDVKYRWILTATPFLRNAWNVYALGKLLGVPWVYSSFREKFFYERALGPGRTIWEMRPGMEIEIATLVHQLGSTVKLEDCIDIPDAVFVTERFALTAAQKTAIKKVQEVLPIVRFTKYHQICGGSLKGNEYEPTVFVESDKVKRVIELAEENDKLIISCRYKAEMEMLRLELRKHNECRWIDMLDGDTKDKQFIVDEFNKASDGILIVNAACSEGWQAPTAQLIVFYSYDFSMKNKIQMEGRIRRIDRPQKVTYLALVCEDSIDEAVVDSLERKQDFDAAIYDYQLKN